MTSYKNALEQASRALRPPDDAYELLLRRRDRKRRNGRIAAGFVGLVVALGGLLIGVVAFTGDRDDGRPASTCGPISDLTHWWPGDGSTDDAVAGRSATLHGDATFGPGLIGQAFVLDGAGDFVSVPHDPTLDLGTADFTVALWVNFNGTVGEQILVEKWVQRSFEPEVVSGWTLTKLPDNHIGFAFAEGMSVDSAPLDIPLGTWIHLAARREGDVFQILMNGELIATRIAPDGVPDLDSPSSLKFGHRGGPDDTRGSISHQGGFLNGRIDEVKLVVGRALSNREIRASVEMGAIGKLC